MVSMALGFAFEPTEDRSKCEHEFSDTLPRSAEGNGATHVGIMAYCIKLKELKTWQDSFSEGANLNPNTVRKFQGKKPRCRIARLAGGKRCGQLSRVFGFFLNRGVGSPD